MTFGEKLQLLRKTKGWTQEELAQKITVSRQALSKWELGAAIPDTENVLQLSRLFCVSTDYLLNDQYDSDRDLPAVHSSNQTISAAYQNKIRIILGACASGFAALGLLILGILSSVFPAVYAVAPVGVTWVRVYDGLFGFLFTHNLEWLLLLCATVLMAGIIAIFFPKVMQVFKKIKTVFMRENQNR